jgi:hypothetical protein
MCILGRAARRGRREEALVETPRRDIRQHLAATCAMAAHIPGAEASYSAPSWKNAARGGRSCRRPARLHGSVGHREIVPPPERGPEVLDRPQPPECSAMDAREQVLPPVDLDAVSVAEDVDRDAFAAQLADHARRVGVEFFDRDVE